MCKEINMKPLKERYSNWIQVPVMQSHKETGIATEHRESQMTAQKMCIATLAWTH